MTIKSTVDVPRELTRSLIETLEIALEHINCCGDGDSELPHPRIIRGWREQLRKLVLLEGKL